MAASGSAPPAIPLWTGMAAVRTSTASWTMPRRLYVMHGRPTSMFSVSHTTITSALILSRYNSKNRIRFRDPISSSPSTTILMFTGNWFEVFRYAATAPSSALIAPLSSADPRPNSRPSRRVSFHGSDFHCST